MAHPEFCVRILAWPAARAEAAAIRETVFVMEQGVPRALEMDDWDERCDHALAYDGDGVAVATGRLLPDGHVGRMAVLREWRGRGAGSAILAALLERARGRGMRRVVLNAQTHAAPFYARFGFTVSSATFTEAGLPHVEMALEL